MVSISVKDMGGSWEVIRSDNKAIYDEAMYDFQALVRARNGIRTLCFLPDCNKSDG